MDARKTFLLLGFAAALPAIGGTVALPDSPAPAFADLESVTNAVRLTIRGADDPAEAVSVKFNTDPWVLIMR